MFAVDKWKLPNIVPQKAEKKRKVASSRTEDSDTHNIQRSKKQKHEHGSKRPLTKTSSTTTATTTATAAEDGKKKVQKDKSKYMPYSKTADRSGTNNVPVAKERAPRKRSPTPEPKAKREKNEREPKGKKGERAPLARPPRHERSATPQKLITTDPPPTFTGLASGARHLTPLQQKMAAKLSGARFRWINEKLYTTTGSEALRLIADRPDMFEEYHAGFRAQVKDWPANPIDIYQARLERLISQDGTGGFEAAAQEEKKKGGGSKKGPLVVADLGCGEAMLAKRVLELDPESRVVDIRSFDLKSANDRITACDIAHLPLPDHSVDIAIFCLSLMGTDFLSFLHEAHRVLKSSGSLWISEIKSRFNDLHAESFCQVLDTLGFTLQHKNESNKMFINLDFCKRKLKPGESKKRLKKGDGGGGGGGGDGEGTSTMDQNALDELQAKKDRKVGTLLKPCTYKKR